MAQAAEVQVWEDIPVRYKTLDDYEQIDRLLREYDGPEDPDFPGLPQPTEPATVDSYDPETAACSPEARAEVAALVCRKAEASSLTASGAFRTGTQETAVASTRGVRAHRAGTFTALLITMTGDSSSGWAKGGSWRVSDIDAEALAGEAIEKATRGLNPQRVEPGARQ